MAVMISPEITHPDLEHRKQTSKPTDDSFTRARDFTLTSIEEGLWRCINSSPMQSVASIILLGFILVITSVMPLAVIYVAAQLYTLATTNAFYTHTFWVQLFVWAVAECVFIFYYQYVAAKVQKRSPRPYLSKKRMKYLLKQAVSHTENGRDFLRGWFFNAPISNLDISHLYEWIAYVFYGKGISDMDDQEHHDALSISHYLNTELEIQLGHKPTTDELRDIKCMTHSLDSVAHIQRPFIFYLVMLTNIG
jgi:membrane protein implicated in regulation of membrane protease activity